ncbi:MAG: class I SAM-dependent methyltransferase [Anaerolineales bacterium]|jgi:SAM-dependent methyltransferase
MDFLRKLFFNIWYYQSEIIQSLPWDTGVSPPELISYLETHRSGRALDLGCGTGTNVITMAKYGWQVTGVDFARRAITVARKKAQQASVDVDLHVDDVTKRTRLSGTYNLILDIGCYHTLPQKSRLTYIHNLKRLLTIDGTYLMYGFLSDNAGSGTGLNDTDLELLSENLRLVKREQGTERGHRPSVWLWFHP